MSPSIIQMFTIGAFVLVVRPDRSLIGIEIIGDTWNCRFKPGECCQIGSDHGYFAVRKILHTKLEQAVSLIKPPG